MCSMWAAGVLGVCQVLLGALEAEPRSWYPPGAETPSSLGVSSTAQLSGAQQVVVALSTL